MRFKKGDKVIYEDNRATIIENLGNFMPMIQFADGRKLRIAYPTKLRKVMSGKEK